MCNWGIIRASSLSIYPKIEESGREGKIRERDIEDETKTIFILLACDTHSIRVRPMISHPHDYIFATGEKLGLRICISVPNNCRRGEGGTKIRERERENEKKTPSIGIERGSRSLHKHPIISHPHD